MKHKFFGNLMILLGVALLLGAVGLTYYNLNVEQTGGETANAVIAAIHEEMPEAPTLGTTPVIYYPTAYVLTEYGVEIPDYVLNPKMKMPKKTIDGIDYIGYIQIPKLGLELPIIAQTSDALLKVAPCRYEGSVYQDNMIIGGHNYRQHFGYLNELSYGDMIHFIDMDGNSFSYEVIDMELIDADDVAGMTAGDWDLTLFTCNMSRSGRITIRCARVGAN